MDKRIITAASVFLAGSLIYGAIAMAADKAPRDESWFWINKVEWGAQFDLVYAGDSRVNRGVWPEASGEALPGLRLANFGFSGQGYSREYMDRLPRLLDPSGKRILVLGITPRSFTPIAIKAGDYKTWSKKRPINHWSLRHLWMGDLFITPHSPATLFGRAASSAPSYKQWHTPDGWMPAERSSHDIKSAEGEYRSLFAGNKQQPGAFEALVENVRKWTGEGITVLCFEPPISPEIKKIEEEMSGFDFAAARRAMQDAGARWVDVPGTFKTFDGHHLDKGDAERYSRDLGSAIAGVLALEPKARPAP